MRFFFFTLKSTDPQLCRLLGSPPGGTNGEPCSAILLEFQWNCLCYGHSGSCSTKKNNINVLIKDIGREIYGKTVKLRIQRHKYLFLIQIHIDFQH